MFREVDEELSDDPDDKGEEGQKTDTDSEEEEDILHNVKLYQSDHNRHTLLKHKNPEEVVVENYSKEILNKKKKAKDGKSFAIAPGILYLLYWHLPVITNLSMQVKEKYQPTG